MKKVFFLIIIFTIQNTTYSQANNWVSISNEYIKVSMDKKTGRFIIYDVINFYPQTSKEAIKLPDYLSDPSPIPIENKELSPILGQDPDVYNYTTINIDGYSVIFGSTDGIWISDPIVDRNNIIYAWRIGGVDIIQKIAITTNIDTQFVDAVSITYDIKNTSTNLTRKVGARLVFDPIIGDYKDIPFFIAQKRPIKNEYYAYRSMIPNYWIGADQKGTLSPLTIKGFLKGKGLITPDEFYLTTMQKILQDKWEFNYNKRNRLSQDDTAVVLKYSPKEVAPNSSITIASTMLAQPSLINKFNDNGLEVRISTFTSKNTTPLPIDIWISNTGPDIFDTVELKLVIPKELEIFGSPKQILHDIGSLTIAKSVSWNIGSKENIGSTYEASIQVQGFKNGIVSSSFEIPITFDLAQNFIEENEKVLEDIAQQINSNIIQLPQSPSINQPLQNTVPKQTNTIILTDFNEGDVEGSTIEQLKKIYRHLRSLNSEDNSQIIKMIETEYQLLKEIQDTENSIHKINIQYEILLGVYKRLYLDKTDIDREQINIQHVIDNIEELQSQLKVQEINFSNITSSFATPLQFE